MVDINTSYSYYIKIAKAVNEGKLEEASEILRKLNRLSVKKKSSKPMRSPHKSYASQQSHVKILK